MCGRTRLLLFLLFFVVGVVQCRRRRIGEPASLSLADRALSRRPLRPGDPQCDGVLAHVLFYGVSHVAGVEVVHRIQVGLCQDVSRVDVWLLNW